MVISHVSGCNLYPQYRYSPHKIDSVWKQKKPILTCVCVCVRAHVCVCNILYDTKATTNQEANSHKTEQKKRGGGGGGG